VGGIGEIIWDEHLFLEPKQVSPKDAEDAKIEIRLMDKGMFMTHSLVNLIWI